MYLYVFSCMPEKMLSIIVYMTCPKDKLHEPAEFPPKLKYAYSQESKVNRAADGLLNDKAGCLRLVTASSVGKAGMIQTYTYIYIHIHSYTCIRIDTCIYIQCMKSAIFNFLQFTSSAEIRGWSSEKRLSTAPLHTFSFKVRICMYMYVCVCICMYMHVYVRISMALTENVLSTKCMYL